MNDLISREGLIKEVCGKCDGACDCCCEENCIRCKRPNMRCDFRKDLDDAPTVDAVPVVRCESCERGIVLQHSNNVVCHGRKMPKNGFCSYGIRRNNGICKED